MLAEKNGALKKSAFFLLAFWFLIFYLQLGDVFKTPLFNNEG